MSSQIRGARCLVSKFMNLFDTALQVKVPTVHFTHKIIIESDCSTVIAAASKSGFDKLHVASIINDLKLKAKYLPEVRFRDVRREQSMIAHELAQLAKRATYSAVWRMQVSQCMESLIAKECNLVSE